jgi:hypothetical protein
MAIFDDVPKVKKHVDLETGEVKEDLQTIIHMFEGKTPVVIQKFKVVKS